MSRQVAVALYVVVMAAVIVGVDFAFLKNAFWDRLVVNIGIVLVFGAFYWGSSAVYEGEPPTTERLSFPRLKSVVTARDWIR